MMMLHRFAAWLSLPVVGLVAGFDFGRNSAYGKDWTWLVLVAGGAGGGDGLAWRQCPTVYPCTLIVVAAVVVLFGALYPNPVPSTLNPQWSLTIHNALRRPRTPSRS